MLKTTLVACVALLSLTLIDKAMAGKNNDNNCAHCGGKGCKNNCCEGPCDPSWKYEVKNCKCVETCGKHCEKCAKYMKCTKCEDGYDLVHAGKSTSSHSYCISKSGTTTGGDADDGYFISLGGTQLDINECCTDNGGCSENAICTNTVGSYTCTCKAGFFGDANGQTCFSVDECDDGSHNCPSDSTCVDTFGSYECDCNKDGYYFDGQACVDQDECLSPELYPCEQHSTCSNTDGSYTCVCDSGYSKVEGVCTDINECDATPSPCSPNEDCTNTEGSYDCSCSEGYLLVEDVCQDINECLADPCPANADCTNTPGSYSCECKEGFRLSGDECVDINECTENTPENTCDANAACSNTIGSFECTCNAGYEGTGLSCENIDECSTNTDECSEDATCTDEVGSYSCECNVGYTGDGFTCQAIVQDETATGTGDLSPTCQDGYYLLSCGMNHPTLWIAYDLERYYSATSQTTCYCKDMYEKECIAWCSQTNVHLTKVSNEYTGNSVTSSCDSANQYVLWCYNQPTGPNAVSKKFQYAYPSSASECDCQYSGKCQAYCGDKSAIENYEIVSVTGTGEVLAVCPEGKTVLGCSSSTEKNTADNFEFYASTYVIPVDTCFCFNRWQVTCYATCGNVVLPDNK